MIVALLMQAAARRAAAAPPPSPPVAGPQITRLNGQLFSVGGCAIDGTTVHATFIYGWDLSYVDDTNFELVLTHADGTVLRTGPTSLTFAVWAPARGAVDGLVRRTVVDASVTLRVRRKSDGATVSSRSASVSATLGACAG